MKQVTLAWIAKRESMRARRTRLGMEGYAHLSAILAESPASLLDFCERAKLRKTAGYRFLMSMHAMGWVHVVDWQSKPRTKPIAVFAFGRGKDVHPPIKTASGRDMLAHFVLPKQQLCPRIAPFCHILNHISEEPISRVDLVEAIQMDKWAVQKAVETLVAVGLARVGDWLTRPQGGSDIPLYAFGSGPAARHPKRQESTQARWVAKMKQIKLLHAMAGPIKTAA